MLRKQIKFFMFFIVVMILLIIGFRANVFAVVSNGFVFPVLGVSQTDPTNNTVDPLTDGWSGNGLGWSGSIGSGHLGQDYYLNSGCSGSSDYTVDQPVYAISNGVVVQVVDNPNTQYGWNDSGDHGWGRVIVIKHTISLGSFDTANSMLTENPNEANPVVVYSLYGHLRKGSILVGVGDIVLKGQEIAKIGKGGVDVSWSCSHLHFEIKNATAYNSTSPPEYCCSSQYVQGVGVGYSGTNGYAPNRYKPSEFIANNSVISSGVGLVAYYPFNGNANDESGNGNNGTVYGATLTTDRFGYADSAHSFDGIDDYITIETNIDFELTTWSITGFIKVNNFPIKATVIIGKNEDATHKYNLVLLLDPNKRVRSQYETCDSEFDHVLYSDMIQSNNWVFFSSVRDGTSGKHTLYINGINVNSGTWNDTPCTNNEKMQIGHLPIAGASGYFNGVIDDIRVYNRALTDAEIQALYNESIPDADGDGYPANVDCNDNDSTVNPGATEGPYGNPTCSDLKDNDCDGLIDAADSNCQAPDLLVSTWTAPANACAGATISIKDTTKNQGTGTAGASQTCFYFSTNTTLDTGDTPLGCRAVPSLNPAAISTGTTSVTLPNVTIGKYYLIAMADDGKVVPETNETNNKKSKAIYIGPDLIVSTLTAPTSAARGTTISIGDTTKNKGCGTAGASTTKFYLSTNTTINIGVDYELGTRPVPALGTNAISTGATSVVIPVGISTGKYYIIANSDDAKVVVEGNETNNKKTKAITINP